MHKKNQKNKIDKKLKKNINQFEQVDKFDIPFIVSNELNFPFLINIEGRQKNHFNHHFILTSVKRRR